jgi:hypothetical protein
VPVTGYVEQLFNALVADGEGERDNSSVARVYERLGQISVKSESIES